MNFDLVDYLFINIEAYRSLLYSILEIFIDKPNDLGLMFLQQFYKITKNKKLFLNILCEKWNGFWLYIEKILNPKEEEISAYLMDIILNVDLKLILIMNVETNVTQIYLINIVYLNT